MRKAILGFVTIWVAIMAWSPVFAGTSDREWFLKLLVKNGVSRSIGLGEGELKKAKVACVCYRTGVAYEAGYLYAIDLGNKVQVVCTLPRFDVEGEVSGTELCGDDQYHVIAR